MARPRAARHNTARRAKRVERRGRVRHISDMDGAERILVEHKAVAAGAWLALLLAGERLLPAVERLGGWRRVFRNAGLWALNVGLSLAVVVPLSRWASETALDWRPEGFGGWAGLAADIVLLDFLIYWWHRANHVVPALWRFHEVHHLDEFLDATTAVRFHFGEVLLSALFRAAVVLALDIPISSVLAFEALVLAAAAFHHSNLRLAPGLERVLSAVVVTPSIHWVHHHAVQADTDSNYGTIFSFWDRPFRSRSATRRAPDMPIGVQSRRDEPFLRLVARPFRRG